MSVLLQFTTSLIEMLSMVYNIVHLAPVLLPTFFFQVFYFSKLQLKTANKQFSSVNNDYEMTFNSDTQVWLCEEDVDLPTVTFNFVPISNLTQHEANSTVGKHGLMETNVGPASQTQTLDQILVFAGLSYTRKTFFDRYTD